MPGPGVGAPGCALPAEVRAVGHTLVVHGRDARYLRLDSQREDDPSLQAFSHLG